MIALRWLLALLCLLAAVSCRDEPRARDAALHDAGQDAASAAQPNTRGTLHGVIIGLSADDAARGVVSAAGKSQALGGTHFYLEGVRAGDAIDVFARIPGYSSSSLRVPIRANQTTSLWLHVTKLETKTVDLAANAQTLSFGSDAARFTLALSKDALRTVYDTQVQGATSVAAARLNPASAPGDASRREQGLVMLAILELRALQPTAALRLTQPATLAIDLVAPASDAQGYRFDAEQHKWKMHPTTAHDAAQPRAQLSLDEFGIYALGTLRAQVGCAALQVMDRAGNALANAAVTYTDGSGHEAGQVWTNALGQACLVAAPNINLAFEVLSAANGHVLRGASELQTSDAADSCKASCGEATQYTVPDAEVRCARGQIADNGLALPIQLTTSDAAGAETRVGQVAPGEAFCVDFAEASSLRFTSELRCPEPRPLASASAASSCGVSSCLDLGTLTCCATLESCGNASDDDCDTRIDEGCQCGDNACGALRLARGSADFCCTAEGTCGQRDRLNKVDTGQCFDIQVEARSDTAQCPDEVVDIGAGKQALPGCCRADQRCGLRIGAFECLPREQAKYFVKAGTSVPAAKRCRY